MIRYITLFITAILLAGCSLIMEDPDAPCPVAEDESDFLNLSFRIMVPVDGMSRTDNAGHTEVGSENPAFEDRIYSDDFCFFIFAGPASGADPAFIAKVHEGSALDDPYTGIAGGPLDYVVKVAIPKGDFNKIVPQGSDKVTFRVVAFANTNKEFDNLAADEYSTYSKLIETASKWDFNIFGTVYTAGSSSLAEAPRIPMYGTLKFDVSRERLSKSSVAAPVWSEEDMCLLRSLAKIKVVDNITRFDDVYPYVKAVTFNTRSMAYTLPDNAAGYVNGNQVHNARIHTASAGLSGLDLMAVAAEGVWACYVPEQVTRTTNGTDAPFFRITVALMKNQDGSEDLRAYDVPMTKYNDTEFKFGDYLLRNHIYTLEVTMKATLECEVDLVPYRSCVLEPGFGLIRPQN